jgi:hypothetical protein
MRLGPELPVTRVAARFVAQLRLTTLILPIATSKAQSEAHGIVTSHRSWKDQHNKISSFRTTTATTETLAASRQMCVFSKLGGLSLFLE